MKERYDKAKKAYDDAVVNVGILLFNLDKDRERYEEQAQAAREGRKRDLIKATDLNINNVIPIGKQRKILFEINETAKEFTKQVQVSGNADEESLFNLKQATSNYQQATYALNTAMNIVEPGFMKRAGIGIGLLAAVIIVGIILTAIPATLPFGIAMIVGGLVGGAVAVGIARNQVAGVIAGELASNAERVDGLKKLQTDFNNIAQPPESKQLSEGKTTGVIGDNTGELFPEANSPKEQTAVGSTPKATDLPKATN